MFQIRRDRSSLELLFPSPLVGPLSLLRRFLKEGLDFNNQVSCKYINSCLYWLKSMVCLHQRILRAYLTLAEWQRNSTLNLPHWQHSGRDDLCDRSCIGDSSPLPSLHTFRSWKTKYSLSHTHLPLKWVAFWPSFDQWYTGENPRGFPRKEIW